MYLEEMSSILVLPLQTIFINVKERNIERGKNIRTNLEMKMNLKRAENWKLGGIDELRGNERDLRKEDWERKGKGRKEWEEKEKGKGETS